MKTSDRAGMTLLEVLVAFIVFVLMIGALVSLANTGLDTWTTGESRKDVYERAQAVMSIVTEDLRNAAVENVMYTDGRDDLMPAALLCDTGAGAAPRLRLVRGGDMERIRVAPAMQLTRRAPTMVYGDYWEVAYVPDSDPTKTVLYRAVRYFDRRKEYTLLRDQDIAKTGSEWFQRHATVLEKGVIYLGFKFWTQDTQTWLPQGARVHTCSVPRHRPLVQLAAPGACPICAAKTVERTVQASEAPSDVWDSTRFLEPGFRYRKPKELADPNFVYPEIVQVTLVIESHASEIRGLRLDAAIGEADTNVRVSETRELPDAPNFVKIDGEWIEYEAKTYDELKARRRGARGTKPASHQVGAIVHFGETFVTEVRLPAYRPAVK